MSTTKKSYGKLIAFIVAVVLIITCACLLIFLPRKQTANAVMECSINPQVQFVLDTNNKVMYVNYLSGDAEYLLSDEELEGKSAQDAAQIFVQLCLESGYMDVNTTNGRVDVTIYCENTQSVEDLSQDVVESINKCFDENGVIAGAVANIKENLEEALHNISSQIEDVADLTSQEILNLITETSEDIKDISWTLRTQLFETIQQLKNSDIFNNIPTLEETVDNLQQQINDSNLTESVKDELNNQLESAQQQLNTLMEQLNDEIDKVIEELRQQSIELFEQAKAFINQKIEDYRQTFEQHKQYFEQHKEAVQAAIEAYRNTLNQ